MLIKDWLETNTGNHNELVFLGLDLDESQLIVLQKRSFGSVHDLRDRQSIRLIDFIAFVERSLNDNTLRVDNNYSNNSFVWGMDPF